MSSFSFSFVAMCLNQRYQCLKQLLIIDLGQAEPRLHNGEIGGDRSGETLRSNFSPRCFAVGPPEIDRWMDDLSTVCRVETIVRDWRIRSEK